MDEFLLNVTTPTDPLPRRRRRGQAARQAEHVRVLRRAFELNQSDDNREREPRQIDNAVVRDMDLGDREDFLATYEIFRITEEEALYAAKDHRRFQQRADRGIFIKSCMDYEYDRFGELMETTKYLKRKGGSHRLEHETIVAKVMEDPVTGEQLAYAMLTVPPANPLTEPRQLGNPGKKTYKEEMEELFAHGGTGGGLQFKRPEQQGTLWREAMKGKMGMIWMILRKAPEAIRRTMREAAGEYRQLKPEIEPSFDPVPQLIRSYCLDSVTVLMHNLPLETPTVPIGRNTGSYVYLNLLGQGEFAHDFNMRPDAPGARFSYQDFTLTVLPKWVHTVGYVESMVRGSEHSPNRLMGGV